MSDQTELWKQTAHAEKDLNKILSQRIATLLEENERLRYLLADVLAHHEQFGGLYSGLEERIKSTIKC